MIPLPLEGVRVIDLTRNWAGPSSTAFLAELGAEVIKIEPPSGDPQRGVRRPGTDAGPAPYNRAAIFNQINRCKRSLALDLSKPDGAAVFRRLASVSDIIVENFRVGVMDRLGIGYETLRGENPGLIMVSISGFGQTGPWRRYIGYGVAVEPLMGLFSVTGYEGAGPMRSGVDHPDPMAGLHAAGAAIAALIRRKRNGQGAHVDVSMVESGTALMGPALLEYQASGRLPERHGNKSGAFAPQGCYRCAGDDEWVALCVRDEKEWLALAGLISRPDLAADEQLLRLVGRKQREAEIDAAITKWTSAIDKSAAMHKLQASGIPAAAVLNVAEAVSGPRAADREIAVRIPHPEGGEVLQLGPRFRIRDAEPRREVMAPFAKDNDYVLTELLRMSNEEVECLYEGRTVTRTPTAP